MLPVLRPALRELKGILVAGNRKGLPRHSTEVVCVDVTAVQRGPTICMLVNQREVPVVGWRKPQHLRRRVISKFIDVIYYWRIPNHIMNAKPGDDSEDLLIPVTNEDAIHQGVINNLACKNHY